jgi:hypothetical protein
LAASSSARWCGTVRWRNSLPLLRHKSSKPVRKPVILLTCFITTVIFFGCRKTVVKGLPEYEPVRSQLCQVNQRLRIGFYAGPNLISLVPCITDANRSVIVEEEAPPSFSPYDYSSPQSPDGKWLAKTREHELEISNQSTEKSRVVVRATKVMTYPRWSPDSNFVFIVTSENLEKKRSFSKCMDDVFEVYVVSAQAGNGTIVGRICAGVPLDGFHWLQK